MTKTQLKQLIKESYSELMTEAKLTKADFLDRDEADKVSEKSKGKKGVYLVGKDDDGNKVYHVGTYESAMKATGKFKQD